MIISRMIELSIHLIHWFIRPSHFLLISNQAPFLHAVYSYLDKLQALGPKDGRHLLA